MIQQLLDYTKFRIDDCNMVIDWCRDNLDDDCWFFKRNVTLPSIQSIYIRGDENIIAFKLRWL